MRKNNSPSIAAPSPLVPLDPSSSSSHQFQSSTSTAPAGTLRPSWTYTEMAPSTSQTTPVPWPRRMIWSSGVWMNTSWNHAVHSGKKRLTFQRGAINWVWINVSSVYRGEYRLNDNEHSCNSWSGSFCLPLAGLADQPLALFLKRSSWVAWLGLQQGTIVLKVCLGDQLIF